MKYFNKPKINDAFCINFELIFRKTGKNLIPEDSYSKQNFKQPFFEFWDGMLGLYFPQFNPSGTKKRLRSRF